MNQHYLELQSEVEKSPEIVLNPHYHVFRSEKMYDPHSKVNHRQLQSVAVYQRLFEQCKIDSDILTSLMIKGASNMREKLCSYAKDQLPVGLYWDADKNVKDILCQLKPSNDVCELILGLNDYLTTVIPNLHQMSRSNLVQVKKNRTMKCVSDLPEEEQLAMVDMAVKQRRCVSKDEERERSEQRKQNMIKENTKRVALQEKMCHEKERLSQLHLITTPEELQELILIDKESISTS